MPYIRLTALALAAVLLTGCPESPPPAPEIPPAESRLARAMKLEDERSAGDGELALLLQDPDDRVRARAALAFGRIGNPSAAGELAPLLSDPSPYVRATAAFALGILDGALPEDAIARLAEALGDEEPRVRARAAEALARGSKERAPELIGAELAKWVPRGAEPYEWNEALTLSSVTLPHPDVRAAFLALGLLRSSDAAWSALATEGATPRFLWWPAAWTASQLPGDRIEPILLFYTGSPDPVLRLYGARGLSGLGPDRARPHLRSLLFDPSETVRIEAIRAASRLEALELVPDLLGHLDADTRYVQAEVLRALVTLPSEATVEPLIDRVGDTSPWIRGLALEALARQDPDGFWLLLSGIGADPDWDVRRRMAELFASMKGERPSRLLAEMLDDEDGRVRAAALRSLLAVSPEAAASHSIRHLAGSDPFEHVAAAEALAAAGSDEAFAPLEQAFLQEKEEDPRIRAALLRSLSALDAEKARPTVTSALEDPNHFLRRAAESILAQSGVEASARPRSSERGLGEYQSSLEVPYSPQAFITTSRGRIEAELFIADAPQTVSNFVKLARAGFFKGNRFYEVVPNGHVATGDPRGDGRGGPGYVIRSERNERPVVRGTLAMIEDERDSGGSRFLITHLPEPALEGRVTVFGLVTSGMEVVDRLEPEDVIQDVTIWDGVTSPYER